MYFLKKVTCFQKKTGIKMLKISLIESENSFMNGIFKKNEKNLTIAFHLIIPLKMIMMKFILLIPFLTLIPICYLFFKRFSKIVKVSFYLINYNIRFYL